ncbi:TPA: hypothetical protein ACXJLS_000488 [Stenotrophomonas maltophilia]|uniref:hypothetical protein n=1 Tax=Stenotrophomonas TaxID=40323 RepID=UPI001F3E360B|nr:MULTISPECIES: hypothetical protein [Stenotrophomonas]
MSHGNQGPDLGKLRREQLRWLMLLVLDRSRPYPIGEAVLAGAAQDMYPDATALEVRRELDYLGTRRLIDITKSPSGPWSAELTRHGVDIVEYSIDCGPGIARPPKYW